MPLGSGSFMHLALSVGSRNGYAAKLVECPGFDPYCCISQEWLVHTCNASSQEVEVILQYIAFETSMGYMRPHLTHTKRVVLAVESQMRSSVETVFWPHKSAAL